MIFAIITTTAKRPLEHRYYVVTASITAAKAHSGYRKRIYEDAQEFRGCYNLHAPDQTIWYPPNSSDLKICLFFEEKIHAHDFVARMVNYNSTHTILRERVVVEERIETVDSQEEAAYVYKNAYKFEDSTSPANTGGDMASNTEVEFGGDPVIQMRSLENLALLKKHETLYKCHIAPKAFYQQYKNDPDNIIYGSHLFHSYFDGDGKRRPEGADWSWGIPPRLQVKFESVGDECIVGETRYTRIIVRIVFTDPEVARAMDGRWREGYEVLGDLSFRSFFYSSNPTRVQDFLKLKCDETDARWRNPDDS